MSENKRSATRYERRVAIEYNLGSAWHPSFTKNMSLGGAFIEDEARPALGQRCQLKFAVPTQKEQIECGGTVRWVDSTGFGVQFDGLRAREVWALGKYFELPL